MLSYLTFTISPEQEGLTVEQLLREQGFSRPEEVFLLTYAPECGVFCLGKEDAK